MKYIVLRNGMQFVEESTQRPSDAIIEYINQVSEGDLPFTSITDGVDGDGNTIKVFTVDAAAKLVSETIASKGSQIIGKYKTLETTIITSIKSKLFANTTESAVANYLELLMMVNNPLKFSRAGLLTEKEILNADNSVLFSKGTNLNTPEKVTLYAKALIDGAEDYAIERHKLKDVFRSDKKAIEES